MKKLVCSLIGGVVLGFSSMVYGQAIDQAEVIEDVARWEIQKVIFHVDRSECMIVYDKVTSDGSPTGKEIKVVFQNIPDNPETPDDESSPEFNQLVQAINSNSNIKQTINQAVRTKLGL